MKLSRLCWTALGLILGTGAASANDQLIQLSKDPNQWVMPAGDYANTRYSTLTQINKDNVKNLRPVWTFSTGVLRGHEGGPLVVGDTMYLSSPFPNNVFALDLNNNGRILWKYEPRQDPSVIPVMCCDTVNRGVAYADGKIFLHQADTALVALDAKTGCTYWSYTAESGVHAGISVGSLSGGKSVAYVVTENGWLHALDDFDAVLDGTRLLPHWRFSEGFNFKRVFFEPRDFDLVLWAAGYSTVPYLEDGPTLSVSDWDQWNQAFNGNFLGYALWFN